MGASQPRGDKLANIKTRVYGNANRWPTIYDANKSVIGANPSLIVPGQVLRLP